MSGVLFPAPAPGEVSRIVVDGDAVAVWNVGGRFYALGDVCPHRGFVLSEGALERQAGGVCIVCPGHFWRYDIETGEHIAGPERIPTYSVVEVDGMLDVSPG